VHKDESAPHRVLGSFGQVEVEGFAVEALAFIVYLYLEEPAPASYADEGDPRGVRLVPMYDGVHEQLSYDEEQGIGLPMPLATRELGYAFQDEGQFRRFGAYGEI